MQLDYDVLVLGGGLAGLSAASSALAKDRRITLGVVTAGSFAASGCGWETHGINAAVGDDDSVELHIQDTLAGGGFLGNPLLVKTLCHGAVEAIADLEAEGIEFQRSENDGDSYSLGFYGGSSKSRSLHWYDLTGRRIMQNLEVRCIRAGAHMLEGRLVVDLLMREGVCCGAIVFNTATGLAERLTARATVLALGGGACVFPIASISSDKNATGIVLGSRNGARLIDIEMVQFHPTGLVGSDLCKPGTLLEEEMRTLGGKLLNNLGERFMERYDKRGELATRDIVARASFLEVREGRGTPNGGVYFDLSSLPAEQIASRFPATLRRLRNCGVDLCSAGVVEVSPTAHFLMGGILIDSLCLTDVSRLIACGEDAGGIHGANRLGGNGVADALVFGKIAGSTAVEVQAEGTVPTHNPDQTLRVVEVESRRARVIERGLKRLMWECAGLVRSQDSLSHAVSVVREMRASLKSKVRQVDLSERLPRWVPRGLSLEVKLEFAELLCQSAKARTESRGAHYREDYPSMVDEPYNVITDRHGEEYVASRRPLVIADGARASSP